MVKLHTYKLKLRFKQYTCTFLPVSTCTCVYIIIVHKKHNIPLPHISLILVVTLTFEVKIPVIKKILNQDPEDIYTPVHE